MEQYTRICDYCRRNVDVGEGVVEDLIWYHTSCWMSIQGKRLKKLSRKIDNGQVTAQEAKEYDDLKKTYDNVSNSGEGINLSSKLSLATKPENAIYSGSACKKLGLNTITKKDTQQILLGGGNNGSVQARIMD